VFPLIIPYGTTRKQRRWPYATWSLVAVNVLLYCYSLALGEDGYHNFIMHYGFIPNSPTLTGIFASMFLHAGLPHLLGNMLFLVVFGACVEDALGWPLYLLFYLSSGVAGSFLYASLSGMSGISRGEPCIGASGAVAGLMGLSALRFHRYHVKIWYFVLLWLFIMVRVFQGTFRLRCSIATGIWAGLELVPAVASLYGMQADRIAHWAHLGGFGLGVLVCLAFGLAKEGSEEHILEEGERAPMSKLADIANLLERDPANAGAWLLYGRSRFKTGHIEDSRNACVRALELYLQQKRPEEAAGAYRELNRRFTSLALGPEVLMRAGGLLDESGHPELALHAYTCLARLDPGTAEAAVAMMKAGRLCQDRGDYATALAWFQAFLKHHPDSEWAPMVRSMLQSAQQSAATAPQPRPVRVEVPPPSPQE